MAEATLAELLRTLYLEGISIYLAVNPGEAKEKYNSITGQYSPLPQIFRSLPAGHSGGGIAPARAIVTNTAVEAYPRYNFPHLHGATCTQERDNNRKSDETAAVSDRARAQQVRIEPCIRPRIVSHNCIESIVAFSSKAY
jgi:hypothetical protein